MQYSKLGNTDIKVSTICLGTMTWGEQNTQDDAFKQIDMALDLGVNFIDLAEMYPVPPKKETQGATETIMGNWLENHGKSKRDQLVIATKVVGRSDNFPHLRGGETRLDRANIERALDASLRRLKTDYIDLYQLHWPDRRANYFGRRNYSHEEQEFIAFSESLEVMRGLIKKGKVRHVGLSNETPWGVMSALGAADKEGVPRVVSIQNPYNLLNRSFEVGLAEMAIREKVGLLAYSPLAFGMLSGKYMNGARPEGARLTEFESFQRYKGGRSEAATGRYVALANKYSLNPAQMALAFVNQQEFVTSNIIGATTLEQLQENIASADVTLSNEVICDIEAIYEEYTDICP